MTTTDLPYDTEPAPERLAEALAALERLRVAPSTLAAYAQYLDIAEEMKDEPESLDEVIQEYREAEEDDSVDFVSVFYDEVERIARQLAGEPEGHRHG